jgi:hypothetical protein
MFLLEQVEVLDKLDGGMSVAAVWHHWGAMEWTIYFVKKNEDKARQSVKANAPLIANFLV